MNENNQEQLNALSKTVANAAGQLPVQVDIVRGLQAEIFGFVGEHLKKIGRVYALREKVQAGIEQNLDTNAYSPQELVGLYRMLTQENDAGTDMIVSLFKPAPGVESFLARNLSEDHTEKDKVAAAADLLKTTSPDMLQKLDALSRWMNNGPEEANKTRLVSPEVKAKAERPWPTDEDETEDS